MSDPEPSASTTPGGRPDPRDPLIIHEGMDRAYMLHTMVEIFLRENGLARADDVFCTHVKAASQALYDAWQRGGELSV